MKILRSLTCCFCFVTFSMPGLCQSEPRPTVEFLSPLRLKVYPLLFLTQEAKVAAEFRLGHKSSLELALNSRRPMVGFHPELPLAGPGNGGSLVFIRKHLGILIAPRFYFGKSNRPGKVAFVQIASLTEFSDLSWTDYSLTGDYDEPNPHDIVQLSPVVLSQSLRGLFGITFGKSRYLSFDFYSGLGAKASWVFLQPLNDHSAQIMGTDPYFTIRPTFHLGLAVAFNLKQPGVW